MFADSGAFSEVAFVDGRPEVTKLIEPGEWRRRLAVYARLADRLGAQLYAVAPDMVAHQAVTLERLRTYAPELHAMREAGANILVPLQPGQRSLAAFDEAAAEAIRFCIFASRRDLEISAQRNPDLLAEYAAMERRTGYDFRQGTALRDLAPASPPPPPPATPAATGGRGCRPRPDTREDQSMTREKQAMDRWTVATCAPDTWQEENVVVTEIEVFDSRAAAVKRRDEQVRWANRQGYKVTTNPSRRDGREVHRATDGAEWVVTLGRAERPVFAQVPDVRVEVLVRFPLRRHEEAFYLTEREGDAIELELRDGRYSPARPERTELARRRSVTIDGEHAGTVGELLDANDFDPVTKALLLQGPGTVRVWQGGGAYEDIVVADAEGAA
ncbi:MAG: hypothetical protein R3F65_23765 [bacterium]